MIHNTIIANNGGVNCSGVTGGSDNLSDDSTCAGFSTGDPLLGPLQVNAPGTTATFALGSGSAAINTGDDAFCPATDQRGVARPQGPHCDIGAYESLCGDGAIEAGEECDDGAANGTTCCTSTCQVGPDTDGDGICDALDPCTNVGGRRTFLTRTTPKIVFSRINTDATLGNDLVRLTGTFSNATDFSSLDPQTNGARVLVKNQAGSPAFDVTLATGPLYGGETTGRGWTKNARGNRWTFVDRTGVPNNGISKMVIIDQRANTLRVAVKGRNGTYPIVSGDEPVQATVVLGGQASAAAGECGESDFVSNDCTFNESLNRLMCKK
jgi:hypothetical protein